MSDRDFGGLVSEARDRLGMSQSRVADLIGRSPSTVRAWERGRAVPSEAGVVSSLAAVLGIDEASLFQAAGMERPGTPPRRTLGESLAEIAPPPSATASAPGFRAQEHQTERRETGSSPSGMGVGLHEADTASQREPEDVALLTRRELRSEAPRAPAPNAEPGGAWAPVLNVMDRIVSRFRRRPQRHALVAQPLAPAVPSSQPSYVEDPEQRLIYRFRSLLLALGVLLLAIVFAWSAGEFLDAVGASLDAILGSE